MYSINFTVYGKEVCLGLRYDCDDSYLFVKVDKLLSLKQKILKLCHIHYVQEIFLKITCNRITWVCVCVDYKAMKNNKIHDIHRYLMKKAILYKMFGLIKKVLLIVIISSVNSLKCISIKNQEFKVREVIINNDYMINQFSMKVNKCNGNWNNISNPYPRVCVPNVIKNITAKVFDLMSWKNKAKEIKWHERCNFKAC